MNMADGALLGLVLIGLTAVSGTAHADPVGVVGNPNCGLPILPSFSESQKQLVQDSNPPSKYFCDEQGFLQTLASNHVTVSDPVTMIKAGYNHVCAVMGPADLDTRGSNYGTAEDAAKAVLASGAVTSNGDAQNVVLAAIKKLC
jgi:hypothetical protein